MYRCLNDRAQKIIISHPGLKEWVPAGRLKSDLISATGTLKVLDACSGASPSMPASPRVAPPENSHHQDGAKSSIRI
jgi:hypothetical protein